ncbi:hypothetical protein [Nocardioides aequoreus]|uniref:hypothetical protein n=1 Tax=Nocardioides aequoreus TaxID=397278 RepID=UPI0004C33F3A|nr:hypothetical protein [Nocardioides aequoreus]
MSDRSTPARPRQVTMAAGLAVGGSLFLLLTVFETLGRLPSVRMREEVAAALDSGSGATLGLSVDQALTAMRVSLWVAAVAAAIALVAGVFVFQRHHGARLVLSAAAVPLLLTAPFTGGLLGILVVAAAGLTWSGPARDWFAGRPVREVSRPERQEPRPDPVREPTPTPSATPGPPAATPSSVSTSSTSTAPAPTQGYGAPGGAAPYADPTAPGGPWSATAPVADRAPLPVRLACALTWTACTLVVLAIVVGLAFFVTDPGVVRPVFDEAMQLQGTAELPAGMITATVWTAALMFGGWALGAIVLAELCRRRHDWARYLLVISAVVSGVLCLLTFPIGLVHAAAAVGVVVLLFRPSARDWFAGRAPQQQPTARQQPW